MLGSRCVFGFSYFRVCRDSALGIAGSGNLRAEENQTIPKEDFALATSEENSPFTSTEKDGELLMSHTKKDPVSCNVWLDPRTLRYLRDKTFGEGASVHEIVFNTGQKVITS